MVTICIAYFYQWATILDFKMAALHYMATSQCTFVVLLGSNDLILVVVVVVVVVVAVVAVVAVMITEMLLCVIPGSS